MWTGREVLVMACPEHGTVWAAQCAQCTHSVHKVCTKCSQRASVHTLSRECTIKMIEHQMRTKHIKMLVENIICFFVHALIFSAGWSARIAGVVWRPEHGSGIDVVELTSASRPVLMITFASCSVARKSTPSMGNSPVLAVGHQSKSAQNVGHRDDIDYRLRRRLIE
jgi:hypothetical protein